MTIRAPSMRPSSGIAIDEALHSQTPLYLGARTSEPADAWRVNTPNRVRHSRNKKVTDQTWHQPLRELGPAPPSLSTAPESESKYDWRMHTLMLCRHILTRGLTDGVASDVVVHVPAWDKVYRLHRLILDQNPYFRVLFEGGFREADADTVTLHFEDNPFITDDSFYFVLTQLYGKHFDPVITEDNVRQILATCSFFQMDHLCKMCVDFMLRTLQEHNVVDYLMFADTHRVQGSDTVLDAIFTFLCREAYVMSPERLVELPAQWLEKVLVSDAFWVPSEYDRYQFAFQLLRNRYNHRQSSRTSDTSPLCPTDGSQPPSSARSSTIVGDGSPDLCLTDDDLKRCSLQPPPGEDTNSFDQEVAEEEQYAFKEIFKSIHYMHFTWEQLQSIQNDINPWTKQPLLPDKVIKDALWDQIGLRAKIVNAQTRDTTLGLTVPASSVSGPLYPIPTDDMATYSGDTSLSWPPDLARRQKLPPRFPNLPSDPPDDEQCAVYPPFRFSVGFADFASLKQNVRVYSKSVFYAGSEWNMYIQKTRSQRKGVLQLGVYLHRQAVPVISQQEDHALLPQSSRRDTSFSIYADKRKTVRTWFKIFCLSRSPKHTMTLFQSSADKFSVLQSWGWRSTTLCADETSDTLASEAVLEKTEDTDHLPTASPTRATFPPLTAPLLATANAVHPGGTVDLAVVDVPTTEASSTSLRFSVVMGHV